MSDAPDLEALLQQAMHLQEQLVEAQQEASTVEVTGTAGGDVVRVTMNGAGGVVRVKISPEVVDPAEVEMLEDLLLAALHDAAAKAREVQHAALGGLGGLGDGLGGISGLLDG